MSFSPKQKEINNRLFREEIEKCDEYVQAFSSLKDKLSFLQNIVKEGDTLIIVNRPSKNSKIDAVNSIGIFENFYPVIGIPKVSDGEMLSPAGFYLTVNYKEGTHKQFFGHKGRKPIFKDPFGGPHHYNAYIIHTAMLLNTENDISKVLANYGTSLDEFERSIKR